LILVKTGENLKWRIGKQLADVMVGSPKMLTMLRSFLIEKLLFICPDKGETGTII
jgi:hypothetical protein